MVSGMVRMRLSPLTALTKAKPTPVLPDVGSMIVAPGLMMPFWSASSTIASAMRSLTDPAGLKYSTFAMMLVCSSSFAEKALS